jgi:hypothetical protein
MTTLKADAVEDTVVEELVMSRSTYQSNTLVVALKVLAVTGCTHTRYFAVIVTEDPKSAAALL